MVHFDSTMKKLIYFTLLAIIILSSCSKSSDDIPPINKNYTEEDFIGTWELYYSSKAVVKNPTSNATIYPVYRDTQYDGLKTEFYKENGQYKYRSINILGVEADKGTYKIQDKSIVFDGVTKGSQGQDSAFQNIANVTDTDFNGGIIKMYQTYNKTSNKEPYKITQAQAFRNVATAPGKYPGVDKVKFDFSQLEGGRWDFSNFEYYQDGEYYKDYSNAVADSLSGHALTFYLQNNVKYCKQRFYWGKDENGEKMWQEYIHQVIIVDDVILLPYILEGEPEPEAFEFWIAKLEIGKDPDTGKDTALKFTIDKQFRADRDLSKMIRTHQYYNKNKIE